MLHVRLTSCLLAVVAPLLAAGGAHANHRCSDYPLPSAYLFSPARFSVAPDHEAWTMTEGAEGESGRFVVTAETKPQVVPFSGVEVPQATFTLEVLTGSCGSLRRVALVGSSEIVSTFQTATTPSLTIGLDPLYARIINTSAPRAWEDVTVAWRPSVTV